MLQRRDDLRVFGYRASFLGSFAAQLKLGRTPRQRRDANSSTSDTGAPRRPEQQPRISQNFLRARPALRKQSSGRLLLHRPSASRNTCILIPGNGQHSSRAAIVRLAAAWRGVAPPAVSTWRWRWRPASRNARARRGRPRWRHVRGTPRWRRRRDDGPLGHVDGRRSRRALRRSRRWSSNC